MTDTKGYSGCADERTLRISNSMRDEAKLRSLQELDPNITGRDNLEKEEGKKQSGEK